MGKLSNIGWTDHTANPWWGCIKVHKGCDFCYAEVLSEKNGNNIWGPNTPRKIIKSFFPNLKKWNESAKNRGVIERVFIASMCDIFEKPMPLIDGKGTKLLFDTGVMRSELFNVIRKYKNLHFQLLTKRPSNINKYIPDHYKTDLPSNIIFGTSISNQQTLRDYVFQLNRVIGPKFISAEPLLDQIDLNDTIITHLGETKKIIDCLDWIILGGESGDNRRPFKNEWAEKVMKDCKDNQKPFFMKQIDKIKPIPNHLLVREFPNILN